MSDIPQGRKELRALARMLERGEVEADEAADEIRYILDEYLLRDPPVRRAPNRPRRITAATKKLVRDYAASNPTAHQVDIGNAFGLNPGRVSEILNGKR